MLNVDVDADKNPHFTHTGAMLYSSYLGKGNKKKRKQFQFIVIILTSSPVVRPIHVCCTLNLLIYFVFIK